MKSNAEVKRFPKADHGARERMAVEDAVQRILKRGVCRSVGRSVYEATAIGIVTRVMKKMQNERWETIKSG